MSHLIKAVIFDYGMVLSLPQLQAPLARMIGLSGLGREEFERIYWKHRLAYDRADVTAEEYWALFGDQTARLPQLIETDAESWNGINRAMVDWALSLKDAGLRIGLLSNIPRETRDYVRAYNPWFEDFHHRTFSCDLNRVKPEAEIYRECLDGLGVAAEETIFIDDRPHNVEGAAAVGMVAIEHKTDGATIEAVEALLER